MRPTSISSRDETCDKCISHLSHIHIHIHISTFSAPYVHMQLYIYAARTRAC
jgi:hypothetical protein